MKRLIFAAALLSSFAIPHSLFAAEPLRVFIRAGKKSHAPGAHDYPQFLKDWVPMLNERGAKADGSLEFPTKEQLDKTDVLILHSQEAGNIAIGDERKNQRMRASRTFCLSWRTTTRRRRSARMVVVWLH